MKHQRSWSKCLPSFTIQCKLQYDVSKKAELDSECLCFHGFPERGFQRPNETEVKHRDLRGDFLNYPNPHVN
jgi:hypothetical protein